MIFNYRKTFIYRAYRGVVVSFFRLLPIQKNKVVFDNFGGKGFGDDPKYIAEGLIKLYPKQFKLIWFTIDMDTPLPETVTPVRYGTLRAAYQLATSKIWVDNIKNSFRIKKRKGQYYIQTWHSTLGLKTNEADAGNLPDNYVKKAKKDAGMTDLMYTNNSFRYEIYKNRFWYGGEVLRCGVPRNSKSIFQNEEIVNKIYQYYKIDRKKKIVLYAPTFRKTWNESAIGFDYNRVCIALKTQFRNEYVCMVRLHPNDLSNIEKLKNQTNIINASKYPDIQELLATANVLITDYSALMFDFSFSLKPVFLLLKDYKEYINNERQLHFTFEELPYEMATNEDELIKNMINFSMEVYHRKCKVFFDRIGLQEDGNGVQVITDIIYKKCFTKNKSKNEE